MKSKPELAIIALVFVLWTDCTIIAYLRELLLDFLIGARNRKSADRIYAEQSFDDQLTLAFVGKYIKRYTREFRFYHRFYLSFLISLVPQAIIIITMIVLFDAELPTRITIYALAVILFFILVLLRLQFDSMWVSRFARKRKNHR